MIQSRARQQGYVLMSVTLVLLTVLAAIVALNQKDTSRMLISAETNSVKREEIEHSAWAHLQAFAEQSNCGIDASSAQQPIDLSISGTKDQFTYSLRWQKNTDGTLLTGNFIDKETDLTWEHSQSNVQLYGATQTTDWILAPYFSQYAEIKADNDNSHHDHSNHAEAKIESGKDIVLRSLKLGPLLTEPVTVVEAKLLLSPESSVSTQLLNTITLNAVKYPWDPDEVTFGSSGIGTRTDWQETGLNNFQTLDTPARFEDPFVSIDMTSLINSWIKRTRPNYGWALTAEGSGKFKWVSGPKSNNFEERPRIHLKYRCACGEACVGIAQDEVLAMSSLSEIDGHGGGRDELAKLWLHRAHQQYLEPNPSGSNGLDRENYFPAGLSDFPIIHVPGGQDVIGLHIEPAQPEHPDHHYYTLMAGTSATSKPLAQSRQNYANAQLIYLQSDADEPIGTALESRELPPPMSETHANNQLVTDFIDDRDFYVGGFSVYDSRYWFGKKKDAGVGVVEIIDIPVERDAGSAALNRVDAGTAAINIDTLQFNALHLQDGLHMLDQYNFLLSAEWTSENLLLGTYENTLGHLAFHDGDIVLYNTVTKTARLIDGEISRSINNNVWAISLYKEPSPPAGSDDGDFKDAFPMLFKTLYNDDSD